MSVTREELHQLVDAVDDDKVPDAATFLRGLAQRGTQSAHALSFVGALDGGRMIWRSGTRTTCASDATGARDDAAGYRTALGSGSRH